MGKVSLVQQLLHETHFMSRTFSNEFKRFLRFEDVWAFACSYLAKNTEQETEQTFVYWIFSHVNYGPYAALRSRSIDHDFDDYKIFENEV